MHTGRSFPVLSWPGTHWAFVPHGFGMQRSSIFNKNHSIIVINNPIDEWESIRLIWRIRKKFIPTRLQILNKKLKIETINYFSYKNFKNIIVIKRYFTFCKWTAAYEGITSHITRTTANRCQSSQITIGVSTTSSIAWIFANTIIASWSSSWTVAIAVTFSTTFCVWATEIVLKQTILLKINKWLTKWN